MIIHWLSKSLKKFSSFSVFVALLLSGCWSSSKSPEIKNESGRQVNMSLLFEKKAPETYTIKSGEQLLFPNLIDEHDFISLQINDDKGEVLVSIDREKVLEYLGDKKSVFVIDEALNVSPKTDR